MRFAPTGRDIRPTGGEEGALTARSGGSLAVMGPSGSGKSTLLACLAGLLPATAGTVQVCGTDVGALRAGKAAAWRLRTIGFVYRFGELLPELSTVENAALPLLIGGTGRRTAYATAERLLAELGVAEVADSPAGVLSGGERQRVAVARALSLIAGSRTATDDGTAGNTTTFPGWTHSGDGAPNNGHDRIKVGL